MKKREREFDIFNLSFLDIVSCGFGAVVMLVLISKYSDDVTVSGKGDVQELIQRLLNLENSISEMQSGIDANLAEAERLSANNQSLQSLVNKLQSEIEEQKRYRKTWMPALKGYRLLNQH